MWASILKKCYGVILQSASDKKYATNIDLQNKFSVSLTHLKKHCKLTSGYTIIKHYQKKNQIKEKKIPIEKKHTT